MIVKITDATGEWRCCSWSEFKAVNKDAEDREWFMSAARRVAAGEVVKMGGGAAPLVTLQRVPTEIVQALALYAIGLHATGLEILRLWSSSDLQFAVQDLRETMTEQAPDLLAQPSPDPDEDAPLSAEVLSEHRNDHADVEG